MSNKYLCSTWNLPDPKVLLLFMALFFLASFKMLSQCAVEIDFNEWSEVGPSGNGDWSPSSNGESVFQSVNGNPTFFVSPSEFMNVRITGSIQVEESTFDDDFVGFVFSALSPTTSTGSSSTNLDLWLLDWKSGFQSTADEGFSLIRINDTFDFSVNEEFMPYFWTHGNSDGFDVKEEVYGTGLGWIPGQLHNFELLLETDRVQIFVDGNLIIDRSDCFDIGSFGFYNFSQENVEYSDFTYEIFTNFEIPSEICMGSSLSPSVFNSECPSADGDILSSLITNWFWQFGDDNYSFQMNPEHVYETAGIYTVTLTVTDALGCSAISEDILTVSERAEITVSEPSGCVNQLITYEASDVNSESPVIGYGWDFNGDGIMDESGSSIDTEFTSPGEYTVQVIGFAEGCNDTVLIHTFINDIPEPDFSVNHLSGRTVLLENNTEMSSTFLWDFGDGSTSTETNPMHTYMEDGEFSISLNASTTSCESTLIQSTSISYEDLTFLPTAFSPNGDGRNDLFRVLGSDISEMEMCIFNHWGELVFTGVSLETGWDGNIKGKKAQAGNYTYLIRGEKYSGEKVSLTGAIALIR